MGKLNDGGPAFPGMKHKNEAYLDTGMSLRDWFAGQALISRLQEEHNHGSWINLAMDCYGIADTMLAEREKQ